MTGIAHGFTDELLKLAESEKKNPRRKQGALAMLAGLGTSEAIAQFITRDLGSESTRGLRRRVRAVAREMELPSMPKIVRSNQSGARVLPGMFRPKLTLLSVPNERESFIAHEAGHLKTTAKRLRKGLLGWAGRTLAEFPYRSRTGTLAIMPGLAAIAALKEEPSMGPAIAAGAIAAPVLANEIDASAQAVRHQTKKHGLLRGLGRSAPLAPALATYAIPAALPYLITKLRQRD